MLACSSYLNHNMANIKCLIPSASPRPLSSGENPLSAGLWDYMRQKTDSNLVPRAHVPFGQHQDTELWNNQFPETKILGLPASRRMRDLV